MSTYRPFDPDENHGDGEHLAEQRASQQDHFGWMADHEQARWERQMDERWTA